jgi:hypothetical protein
LAAEQVRIAGAPVGEDDAVLMADDLRDPHAVLRCGEGFGEAPEHGEATAREDAAHHRRYRGQAEAVP